MGRSLASTIVLAPLALLGACLEAPPTSSVPFRTTAERQTRYAAEIALAVKEDRRGEVSEAAANGRMVLPQLPEIWGPAADQNPRQASPALDLAGLEPGAGSVPTGRGCVAIPPEPPGNPAGCRASWRGRAPILPPFDDHPLLPAAALLRVEPIEQASGPETGPSS